SWERMPAEGRNGVDYRGESVYVAAGPPPAPPPPEPPALAIAPGQSAMGHLLGPGTASVRTRSTATVTPEAPPEANARARSAGPPPAPPALPIAPGQSAMVHLLGPGTATVRTRSTATVTTETPQEISVRTRWLGPFPAAPDPIPPARPVSVLTIPITDAWQEQAVPLPSGWTTIELSTDVGAADVQVIATDGARHPSDDESLLERPEERRVGNEC